jgi:hypothetical protein
VCLKVESSVLLSILDQNRTWWVVETKEIFVTWIYFFNPFKLYCVVWGKTEISGFFFLSKWLTFLIPFIRVEIIHPFTISLSYQASSIRNLGIDIYLLMAWVFLVYSADFRIYCIDLFSPSHPFSIFKIFMGSFPLFYIYIWYLLHYMYVFVESPFLDYFHHQWIMYFLFLCILTA